MESCAALPFEWPKGCFFVEAGLFHFRVEVVSKIYGCTIISSYLLKFVQKQVL